jgi:hypothetical protein
MKGIVKKRGLRLTIGSNYFKDMKEFSMIELQDKAIRRLDDCFNKNYHYNNDQARQYLVEIHKCLQQIEPMYYELKYEDFGMYGGVPYEQYLFYMGSIYMFLKKGDYWEALDKIEEMYYFFGKSRYANILFSDNVMYNLRHLLSQIGGMRMLQRFEDELDFKKQKK